MSKSTRERVKCTLKKVLPNLLNCYYEEILNKISKRFHILDRRKVMVVEGRKYQDCICNEFRSNKCAYVGNCKKIKMYIEEIL